MIFESVKNTLKNSSSDTVFPDNFNQTFNENVRLTSQQY